jgi:hypothetical protein
MNSPSAANTAASPPQNNLHDRLAILRAIADWGIFRDGGRWDELRSLYARDAVMVTTWLKGSADEFVDRSKAAFARGARGQHFIGNSSVAVSRTVRWPIPA